MVVKLEKSPSRSGSLPEARGYSIAHESSIRSTRTTPLTKARTASTTPSSESVTRDMDSNDGQALFIEALPASRQLESTPSPARKPVRLCLFQTRPHLPPILNPLQNVLAILVQLERCDQTIARMNAQWDCVAVGLLARHTVDVDEILEAVDRRDLAFAALVGASSDGDDVILANWNGADLE